MQNIFIEFLPPWVETGLQPAFYDKESGTVLQQVSRMYAKMNELIGNVNKFEKDSKDVVDEYITKFVELHDYVHDYFDNLDVQEEINNKLDVMAEDGTLNTIIQNYDKCTFIAPKALNASVSSYDANLILYRDKSIAIDIGYSSVYSSIVDMYSSYGVTALDYLIITHWDADHIGNLAQMVANGIITDDTVVYMPAQPSYIDAGTISSYTSILTNAGIDYITPTTGDTLEIGLLKFTFLNCDLEQLEQYAGLIDKHNLMSTVLYIEHIDTKAVYVADADNEALQHIFDENQIPTTVDLFKISHHGFNTNTSQQFIRSIAPKYAIQTSALSRISDGTASFCPQITLLDEMGCQIYVCGLNADYIQLSSFGHGITVDKGHPFTTSNYKTGKTIYVDVSVGRSDYQDGSQDHPYKEIAMAIADITNYALDSATISLADGIYGVSEASPATRKASVWLSSIPTRIVISGNSEDRSAVKLYGVQNYNSCVLLQNLTILCDYRHGVECRNANVNLSNVQFTTISGTASSYNAVEAYASQVTLNSCDIEYVNKAFNTSQGCIMNVRTVNIDNVTDTTYIPEIGDTIWNVINLNSGAYDFQPNMYNPPINLYVAPNDTDYTIGSVTIPNTFDDYHALDVTLVTPGSRFLNVRIYSPRNGINYPITSTFSSDQYMYIQTVSIRLSDDNKLTLALETRLRITRADGTFQWTEYPSSGNHYFKFWVVRGIKERVIADSSLIE